MKILHCPTDVAKQAWLISRAQRKLGHKSDVMVYKMNKYYNFNYEYNLHLERVPKPFSYAIGLLKLIKFLPKFLKEYDIFHFHTKSMLPNNYDVILAKRINKKIIFHFHGCDIRLDYHGPCKVCLKINKNSKLKLIENSSKFGDLIIVSTPDLLRYIPNSVLIENSIDTEKWKCKKKENNNEKITIVHSPSDRALKGTYYVESAIYELKNMGYDVELVLVENVQNIEVKKIIQIADIAIDQLIVGWYGVFAIECMSMGVPTCAYIRSDLKNYAKKCPIINVTPKNLVEKLRILIEDEKLRKKIGKKSRKFVESHHDYIKNAKKIINLYKSI